MAVAGIFCFTTTFGQPDPPKLRCISVETNGTVTLTWLAPAAIVNFGGYHIYYSTAASGPYLPCDSIFTFNTLTTTVSGVNANNSPLYFYIKSRDGCCNNYSVSSDTLRSMRMIVTPLSNEAVRLNWNRIHNPPLPSTVSNFVVSKELTTGVFTNFRTLLDTTTTDTNIYCSKFINYKVTQGDLSGCQSVSSIDGELFRDTKGPAKPLLDTVSVDPVTGDVHISWFPDSSADTRGYVLYQFNGISYDSIGAVLGINTTSYIHTGANASSVVETYTVAAFDSCKNLGALATNHNTILLNKSFVKCTAVASLEWTPYVNLYNGLQRYEIWYSENAGPWTQDGFVPPSVLTYEKLLTVQGATYEFLIRAVGNDGQTASSNTRVQVADIFNQPAFLYIRSLNVIGNDVLVNCHVDPAGDIISYRLYKADASIGPFSLVAEVPYVPQSSIEFTDIASGAATSQKFYKMTATDSCGLEQIESNVAGSVFLIAEGGSDYISQLNWIDYLGWPGPTGYFNLYYVVHGVVNTTPFASVTADTLTYSDDVSEYPVENGNICYVVQAVEAGVNIYGFQDNSMSNEACAPQGPVAYIPNAFTPGGKNPVFKPIVLYAEPSTYSLHIFNRWGQRIFFSDSPDEGWDGKSETKDSPTGIYAYLLVFKGFNKKEVRRSGTVMLAR